MATQVARLQPLPPEALARLDPIDAWVYHLVEDALRDLAAEPGEIGDAVRRLRPDLARADPPSGTETRPQ